MALTRLNELIEDGKKQRGRWRIGKSGELEFVSSGPDAQVRLKAPLVAAEPDALVASLTRRQSGHKTVTNLIKLRGTWKADTANRLVFEAERESGRSDSLAFQGTWDIDGRQRIVYRTRKGARVLTFDGHWDLSEKGRLTYVLSASGDSSFRFRAALQTKSILAKKGEIRYQLGAEARGRGRIRAVTLFGRWVVSKDLGVSFEMETASGRVRSTEFSGDLAFKGGTFTIALKDRSGKLLGLELLFTRRFTW